MPVVWESVHLATDTESGRSVALKHAHEGRHPADREARIARDLRHPRIVALIVLGRRYPLHELRPQPVSWRDAADEPADLQPESGRTARRVEHLVAGVRIRLSRAGVSGLTREEDRRAGRQRAQRQPAARAAAAEHDTGAARSGPARPGGIARWLPARTIGGTCEPGASVSAHNAL